MAEDKKTISIEFGDSAQAQGLASQGQAAEAELAAKAEREREEKEFAQLREDWMRQEAADRKEVEDMLMESTRREWARQDEADKRQQQREQDAAAKAYYKQRSPGFQSLADSFLGDGEGNRPGVTDLNQLMDELLSSQEGWAEELDALTGQTRQARGGLAGFVSSIGKAISALVGGGAASGGAGALGAAGGAAEGGVGVGLAGAAGAAGIALLALVGGVALFDKVVDSLVEQVGGFSREVVQASVRSRLQELEDRMRLAREAGGTIADLERTRSDIMSEVRGIVRESIELFGPAINIIADIFLETPLSAIRSLLETINDGIDHLEGNSDVDLDIAAQGNDVRRKMLEEARKARKERENNLKNFQVIEDLFSSQFLEMQRIRGQRSKPGPPGAPPFI